jgi:hypothetical protein
MSFHTHTGCLKARTRRQEVVLEHGRRVVAEGCLTMTTDHAGAVLLQRFPQLIALHNIFLILFSTSGFQCAWYQAGGLPLPAY